MFLWLGTSKSAKRVKGGREQTAFCPECSEKTRFVEVEIVEKLQLFSAIDLLDDRERAFRCLECDSIGKIVESGELAAGDLEELSPEAAARLKRARAEAERERRQRERREREARAGTELAALKARMGLAHETETETEPPQSWWRRWRRKKS